MSPTSPTASPSRTLLTLTRRALEGASLEFSGRALVVAVSGGPDSLALLHALWSLRQRFGYALWVAHLDHALRPGSEEDAAFVQQIARALQLPSIIQRRPVRAFQAEERRLSLETRARKARYAFLQEVASQAGAEAVALGHTADDQAETVLLHLLRGAALPGLAGMRAVAPWPEGDAPGLRVLRPLLEATRRDTEAYCRACGLEPRRDPSNNDLRYARNRVRHRLLPLLEEYNPRIRDALRRLARAATRDESFLEEEATRHLERLAHLQGATKEGSVSLPRRGLCALSPALQVHVLRLAYARMAGSAEGLGQRHLEAMLELGNGPAGRRLDLPGGIQMRADYESVVMDLRRGGGVALPEAATLEVPGTISFSFGLWELCASLIEGPMPPSDDAYRVLLDAEAVGRVLSVRVRRPGDRFQPLGMLQAKKLQDFLVDEKVPRECRDALPLVEGSRGIVWVVGRRIAHWARVTPQTRQVLVMEAVTSSQSSSEL